MENDVEVDEKGMPAGSDAPADAAASGGDGGAEAATVGPEADDRPASVDVGAADDPLRRERDELSAKLAQQRDQLLRLAADFDNFRKRSQRQEVETAERLCADVLRGMLPVADNLERALSHAEAAPEVASVVDGVRLVLKQFRDALAVHGVARVDGSVGQPFDPALHDAISQMDSAGAPPGTVVTELQAGYTFRERLLRPALVVVARPPKPQAVESAPVDGGKTEVADGAGGGQPRGDTEGN